MDEHMVAHLAEIEEIDDGREPFRPIRHHFGITSFGITTWTGRAAGDRIINEHDEAGENEELYVVQSGRATFELDDARVDAPAGTFVFARPGMKRTAYAEEPQTTILAVGGTPGQAYEADGWGIWAPFNRLYLEGRYAEAADGARDVAGAHPEYAGLLYNLACCESLAGRTAEAIEQLRLAIDKSARFRSFASDDSDFPPDSRGAHIPGPRRGLIPSAHARWISNPPSASDADIPRSLPQRRRRGCPSPRCNRARGTRASGGPRADHRGCRLGESRPLDGTGLRDP